MNKRITSILNHKGGVGKTAISTNLSFSLASKGYKTLLIDLDPQGHTCITYCLEIDEENTVSNVIKDRSYNIKNAIVPAIVNSEPFENLFILPSSLELSLTEVEIYGRTRFEKLLLRQLKKIEKDFDFIIIDCPPNLGPLTQNAIFCSDHLIIPVNYDKFSLRGVKSLLDKILDVKEDQEDYELHILRNIRDKREKIMLDQVEQEIKNHIPKEQVLNTIIRKASILGQARSELEPIATYAPKSSINQDFLELADEYITLSNKNREVTNA